MRSWLLILLIINITFILSGCKVDTHEVDNPTDPRAFYFGVDLSYVNQIQDRGGIYKVNNTIQDPYRIFKDKGTTLVRFRLWHNPTWTKSVYSPPISQMYNDLNDVEKGIAKAKAEDMGILLDFHYSDSWADPEKQEPPAAWKSITSHSVLKDSIYQYTFRTLQQLKEKDLLPDMIQIGNETNCGILLTNAPSGFPSSNVCNNQWIMAGELYNSAILAVRNISPDIEIILHIADPQYMDWWFDGITTQGKVTDFDIMGFSYYPIWHTTISISQLKGTVQSLKGKYKRDIMILETAYPWTTTGNDSYANVFGSQAVTGYPITQQGQRDIMIAIVTAMRDGGGIGVVYWEPAWITSNLKDLWGTGSSWENCAFFNYDGNAHLGFDYMRYVY